MCSSMLCELRGSSGMEVNFFKIPHRLGPEFLKSIRKLPGQFFVMDQQGSESPFRDKRMVQAEDDDFIVNDMERMTKFSGISHSGYVFQLALELSEKR